MAMTAAALMAAVKAARAEARDEAKGSYPWIRSRGTYLCTAGRGGDQVAPRPEAECPDWSGRHLEAMNLVAEVLAKHPSVDRVYISGGFDGADTHAALYKDFDYEPWVSTWDVTVWTRDGGLA